MKMFIIFNAMNWNHFQLPLQYTVYTIVYNSAKVVANQIMAVCKSKFHKNENNFLFYFAKKVSIFYYILCLDIRRLDA